MRLSKRFVLRRTKDLVMTDLPPRLDRDEYLELAPAHLDRLALGHGVGEAHVAPAQDLEALFLDAPGELVLHGVTHAVEVDRARSDQ